MKAKQMLELLKDIDKDIGLGELDVVVQVKHPVGQEEHDIQTVGVIPERKAYHQKARLVIFVPPPTVHVTVI